MGKTIKVFLGGILLASAFMLASCGNVEVSPSVVISDFSDVTFNDSSFTYDGEEHSIFISGTLPEGVNVEYAGNEKIDAGSYKVVASFTDTTGKYGTFSDLSATLTIDKADYDMSKVTFNSAAFTYDGSEKKIEIEGELPEGVNVSYKDNTLTDVGSKTATASFSHSNPNYNKIPDMQASLTISKSSLKGLSFRGQEFTYDGSAHSLSVEGELPSDVHVTYYNNGQVSAGSYSVVAHFSSDGNNYVLPDDMTANLVILKAKLPVPGVDGYNPNTGEINLSCSGEAGGYILNINGTVYTIKGSSYTVSSELHSSGFKAFFIACPAEGDNNHVNSDPCDTKTFYGEVVNVKYKDGILSWDKVQWATSYRLIILSHQIFLESSDNYFAVDIGSKDKLTGYLYALGNANDCFDGLPSDTFYFQKIDSPSLTYSSGTISWSPIEHATGYIVIVNGEKGSMTSATSYTLPIDSAKSYKIVIEACASDGYIESYSTTETVPACSNADLSYADNLLSWNAASEATNYILVIDSTPVYLDSSVLSYHTSFKSGESHKVGLIVVSASSSSVYCALCNPISLNILDLVTGLAIKDGLITWNEVDHADYYDIKVGNDVYGSTVNSFDAGASDLTGQLTVSVRGRSNSYTSTDYSSSLTCTILDKVSNVVSSGEGLTWNKVAGAKSYIIKIDNNEFPVSTNYYAFDESNEYLVSIRAIGGDDYLSSGYNTEGSFIKILSPSYVHVSAGQLVWNKVDNAVSYLVNIDGTDFISLTNSFAIPSSVTSTYLSIKVKAIAASGSSYMDSAYSAAKYFYKNSNAAITREDKVLTWTNVPGVTDYLVILGGEGGSTTDAGNVTTYTIPDADILSLTNGSDHLLTLVSVGDDTLLSSYTDLGINVLNMKNVQVSSSNVITWDQVIGASYYEVNVDGTINKVSQNTAPSYNLGGTDLSKLVSIKACGSYALSTGAWTHFSVKVYKDGTYSSTYDVAPGGNVKMLSDSSTSYMAVFYTDASYSTVIDSSAAILKDQSLYIAYSYFSYQNGADYMYYGLYPQTKVSDSALIASLDGLSSTNSQGYYEYQGFMYAKVKASVYQSGYVFRDGTAVTADKNYYFKVEPIKWKVLKTSSNTFTLLSAYVLTSHLFNTTSGESTVNGVTYKANNYYNSTIRSWLNSDFLSQAFRLDSTFIDTTSVDNSLSSTGQSNNSYVCDNTQDKVFLLSRSETTSSDFGFSDDNSRLCEATDYTIANQIELSCSSSHYYTCNWWTRSPWQRPTNATDQQYVSAPDKNGSLTVYLYQVNTDDIGVRPAITVTLG
jgi:hypothetical protein